jgi:hypothetical protein
MAVFPGAKQLAYFQQVTMLILRVQIWGRRNLCGLYVFFMNYSVNFNAVNFRKIPRNVYLLASWGTRYLIQTNQGECPRDAGDVVTDANLV